jgi:hypothetical protein
MHAMDDDETRQARVQLSLTQVFAGAVAAMVGSLVASRLGLAGTVIGAAVISVVATVLTALNVNSVMRVRERARLARLAAARTRLEQRRRAEHVTPALPSEQQEADDTADLAEIAELEAEEVEDEAGRGRFTVADRRGYHWAVIAGVSALVFVIAMVGITVVEKITGKAIACSLGRDCENSTTIPLPGDAKPSKTPSPSPSTIPSVTPTPTPSATPTPTPTPTPSDTVSPTPSDTVSPNPSDALTSPSPS